MNKSDLLKFGLWVIILATTCILLIYMEAWPIAAIYWLPIGWLLGIIILLWRWFLNVKKLFILLHIILGLAITFSFLLYWLYLYFFPETAFNDHDRFREVSNLMFRSENIIYPAIYLLTFVLIVDGVLFLKRSRNS